MMSTAYIREDEKRQLPASRAVRAVRDSPIQIRNLCTTLCTDNRDIVTRRSVTSFQRAVIELRIDVLEMFPRYRGACVAVGGVKRIQDRRRRVVERSRRRPRNVRGTGNVRCSRECTILWLVDDAIQHDLEHDVDVHEHGLRDVHSVGPLDMFNTTNGQSIHEARCKG
jgi:hypothetical protein